MLNDLKFIKFSLKLKFPPVRSSRSSINFDSNSDRFVNFSPIILSFNRARRPDFYPSAIVANRSCSDRSCYIGFFLEARINVVS